LKHSILLVSFFLIFIFKAPSFSQDINQYVSIDTPAVWVDEKTIASETFALGKDDGTQYLLLDKQYRMSDVADDRYVHFAVKLQSPTAVEENAGISIDFDPSYQKIKIHHIRIIRGGEIIEKDDISKFDMYRLETDRERLIYYGEMQLSYLLTDVRVGDVIDYAYSISGKNPAIGPHFALNLQHQYSAPVQFAATRVLVPKGTSLSYKRQFGAIEPEVKTTSEYDIYEWNFKDLPELIADEGLPNWYFSYPLTQMSTFKSWREVGQYFAPFYATPDDIPTSILKIADDIRAKSDDPKVRLRQALDFVQREVRYLGIELGAGGYIPRAPETVLSRRFGDCKDVTVLLITILSALDIEAVPLLVNLDAKGGVAKEVPSYGAFDHVVVLAEVDGQKYVLDATDDQQLGSLDKLQQGDFDKGVIVSDDSPGMVDVVAPAPRYFKDIKDVYDLVSDPNTITLKTTSNYYMAHADRMLRWYEETDQKSAERSFLNYYKKQFPTIIQDGPLLFKRFDELGKVSIHVNYKIPKAWDVDAETGIKDFTVYAQDVQNDFPDFIRVERTSPYGVLHPVKTRQEIHFILNDKWELEDNRFTKKTEAFEYEHTSKFESYIYKSVFSYKTTSDHITPDNFQTAVSALDEIIDQNGVQLTWMPSLILGDFSEEQILYFVLVLLGLIVLISVIVIVKKGTMI